MTLFSIAVLLSTMGQASMASGGNEPVSIRIYTVSSIPVQVPPSLRDSTTVIHLDRLGEIESVLAEGLDRIPVRSREAAAAKRLSPALQRELKKTWQALSRIRQDRITHLPAIILDDRAVWYGSDLRRAVTRYRNLRNAEGDS